MKELYSKWHPKDLEIVSVNLDLDEPTMTKAVKSLSLPWPQIMVPGEPSARELWHKVTGISSIPRCLIVDRQGILQADCKPKELEQELERLIGLETPPIIATVIIKAQRHKTLALGLILILLLLIGFSLYFLKQRIRNQIL